MTDMPQSFPKSVGSNAKTAGASNHAILTMCLSVGRQARHLTPPKLLELYLGADDLALGVCVYEKLDQQVFTRLVVVAMAITGSSYIISSAIDLHANPSRPL